MPTMFVKKSFKPDLYAHIYNRGANKNEIFLIDADYHFFREQARKLLEIFQPSIELITYCLMPNHYHFLLYQRETYAISKFMHSLGTIYSMYFNKKYDHSGQLCQGPYKLAPLYSFEKIRKTEEYILRNPTKAGYESWEHVGWVI